MDLKTYQQYIKVLYQNFHYGELTVPSDFPKELFSDKTFVRLAMYYIPNQNLLELLPDEFKSDRELMFDFVKNDTDNIRYVPEKYRDDKEIVLRAVSDYYWAIEYVSDRLKNDREVVLAAVKQKGAAVRYLSEQFLDDREIISIAIKTYGLALSYASERFRGDKQLVMEAVKKPFIGDFECISPLRYASEELKNDIEVIKEAVKYLPEAVDDIPDDLFYDSSFIRKLAKVNIEIYKVDRVVDHLFIDNVVEAFIDAGADLEFLNYIPDDNADNEELVKALINNTEPHKVFKLFKNNVSKRLQNDVEMMLLVLGRENYGHRSINTDMQEDEEGTPFLPEEGDL